MLRSPAWARVGLGLWPDDESPYRQEGAGATERLLWHAAGVPVAWIDTSHAGDDGRRERAVGRWLAALPADSRPAVMTKGGIVADGSVGAGHCISALHPSVLEAHLDASLRAFGIEAVDAYLLHYPDETGVPIEVSWEAVAGLVADGRARRAGLCAFDVDAVRRCEAVRHVDLCMTRLDPFNLDAQLPLLEWCEQTGTDVVVWTPGDESRVFDPSYSGPLSRTPYDRPTVKLDRLLASNLAAEMNALAVVRDVALKAGVEPEGVVCAWLLAQPGVTGVTVGAERGAQLDRWSSGADITLCAADLERVTRTRDMALSSLSRVGSSGR
jgi:aryl-alcohol dehydrogenase-like predicted oxidoreductase